MIPRENVLGLYSWRPEAAGDTFGDAISAVVVAHTLRKALIDPARSPPRRRLLAGGSIIERARDGDAIWGSGLRTLPAWTHATRPRDLDVRALRGPITESILRRHGYAVPGIYGDPAILLPRRLRLAPAEKRHAWSLVTHWQDGAPPEAEGHAISTLEPWPQVLAHIRASQLVVSSALHGLVLAEAFGVPAAYLRLGAQEPLLKYEDYYAATNRELVVHRSLKRALAAPPRRPRIPDPDRLLQAFPYDLWPFPSGPCRALPRGPGPRPAAASQPAGVVLRRADPGLPQAAAEMTKPPAPGRAGGSHPAPSPRRSGVRNRGDDQALAPAPDLVMAAAADTQAIGQRRQRRPTRPDSRGRERCPRPLRTPARGHSMVTQDFLAKQPPTQSIEIPKGNGVQGRNRTTDTVMKRHVIENQDAPEQSQDRMGRVPNPTVHIALNQLRRLVNALIAEYGPPAQIVIELARELKWNQKRKEEYNRQLADNTKANERRRAKLAELGQDDNGENRLRLRLYEELPPDERVCVYSGKPISCGRPCKRPSRRPASPSSRKTAAAPDYG